MIRAGCSFRLGGALLALALLGTSCSRTESPGDSKRPRRLGSVTFPSSGAREAQPHFERGVAALHSFWYDEASAAFAAALRIDPNFAMAWWGTAMCCKRPFVGGSDLDAGRRALARIPADAKLTERERGFISALRAWYAEGSVETRALAYASAMQQLHEAFPDDAEAALFYVLSLLGQDWLDDPDFARHRRAGEIAARWYGRNPNHPGAAHYLIHCFDAPTLADQALPAARHYAAIAPDVPHALHMPSHVFLQLGMWNETAASNLAAWAASEKWVTQTRANPDRRDYHTLHWLIYARLQQGRHREAGELLARFKAMRAEIAPEEFHFLYKAGAAFVVETRRWDQADVFFGDIPQPDNSTAIAVSGSALRNREWCGADLLASGDVLTLQLANIPDFIRALAAAERGATDADVLLNRLVLAAGGDAMPDFWRIRVREIAAVSNARDNAFDAAIKTLRQATVLEENLGRPPGPPAAYKPPHELLGEILLRAGKPAEAREQFRANLARHPNRSLSVLGLARASAAVGDVPEARAAYALLQEIWRDADADLPELSEVRAFLRANHG